MIKGQIALADRGQGILKTLKRANFKSFLKNIKKDEKVIVDFEGVVTFTPSWGDEFLGFLHDEYGDRLVLKNTENLSVKASLKILEKVYKDKFKIE